MSNLLDNVPLELTPGPFPLCILEKKRQEMGYVDRFENIKELVMFRGQEVFRLSGEEARLLYRHLRPPLN